MECGAGEIAAADLDEDLGRCTGHLFREPEVLGQ